jgi:hypothetical protein
MPDACDLVRQNCGDPGFKCTWIVTDPNDPASPNETECLPVGDVALEASCTRTPDRGAASIGHDDCTAGGFCADVGLAFDPAPTGACRAFCESNADCPPRQRCSGIDGLNPRAGLCLPECALASSTDQVCEAGWTCGPMTDIEGIATSRCRLLGQGVDGEACATHEDCGAEMVCAGKGGALTCNPLCAAPDAPCDATRVCTAQDWIQWGYGVCLVPTCPEGTTACGTDACCGAGSVCENNQCVQANQCPADPGGGDPCPAGCTDCIAGVCMIDCQGDKCSNGEGPPNGFAVNCPDNINCRVDCTNGGCIGAHIRCPNVGTCTIACGGANACQDGRVTCGKSACSVESCGTSVPPGDAPYFIQWDCADSCGCTPGCLFGGGGR